MMMPSQHLLTFNFHIAFLTMLLFSTVKVFPEWNHFSEPWNVFFWVSHLHLKWTFVARACEGLQGSTRGANGSRIKNILGKEKWFHEETFYKLRMELCSMITGIVCFQWRKHCFRIFLHCFLHEWRKRWRNGFLHCFLHSWRKQWRKHTIPVIIEQSSILNL